MAALIFGEWIDIQRTQAVIQITVI